MNQITNPKISVIGLGYVGLPLALSFAKKTSVTGFDVNEEKILLLQQGKDPTQEIGDKVIQNSSLLFSSDETDLLQCNFHIIAVPTPIQKNFVPDLEPIVSACKIIGRNLRFGSIIVFESTVYPGTTEEICIPILEETSGLKCGIDFYVGYSPERINPGDSIHTLPNVVKVVSAVDSKTLDIVAETYSLIIEAGIYKAPSIRVAEAAKILENTQRDVNIAFINEAAMLFQELGIDIYEVLDAAETKWNFIGLHPGFVGGHCIGVDSYYLLSKAKAIGYHSDLLLSARRVNESMAKYVANLTVKSFINGNKNILNGKVLIMGITFKENIRDIRNSGVISIIKELEKYGFNVLVTDPYANPESVKQDYGIELIPEESLTTIHDLDAIIVTVSHKPYENLDFMALKELYHTPPYILLDTKKIFSKDTLKQNDFLYQTL